ncbi:hypothetical protein [Shewanella subflava]|uniref:Uncharacterized protein n=1 Tax=Shewanella subflava TaxID=2986476 RepID=A0ABT3I6T1_9GAMM|nr:hypothetical protein [Shewanella subflava]MCW3171665.1 hypothetical protein [Shewanella subflava]
MLKLIFKLFFIGLVSCLLAFFTYEYVAIAELQPVVSTLQNISAAIFTISGIWIAYMYPEAISAYTKTDNVALLKGADNIKRITDLVLIITSSAFVLIGTLFFNLADVFLINPKSALFVIYELRINFIMLSILLSLILIQLNAVWGIIVNNIKFVDRLYNLKTQKEVNDDL